MLHLIIMFYVYCTVIWPDPGLLLMSGLVKKHPCGIFLLEAGISSAVIKLPLAVIMLMHPQLAVFNQLWASCLWFLIPVVPAMHATSGVLLTKSIIGSVQTSFFVQSRASKKA